MLSVTHSNLVCSARGRALCGGVSAAIAPAVKGPALACCIEGGGEAGGTAPRIRIRRPGSGVAGGDETAEVAPVAEKADLEKLPPLHQAANDGDLDAVRRLFEADPLLSLDSKSKAGNPPLYFAVCAGARGRGVTEELLARGADVNAAGKDGTVPLHIASCGGDLGNNAPDAAARDGYYEIAELLLKSGAVVDPKNRIGQTPLLLAATVNFRRAAELLILNGADVNAQDEDGHAPLHAAAHGDARETAELLISRGADINMKSGGKHCFTPLLWAVNKKALATAELLVAREADVNMKSEGEATFTPLMWAALGSPSYQMAEMLLKNGADVNARDGKGVPLLHMTAGKDDCEMTELLILHGADIDITYADNFTPLHYAAMNNARKAVELLLNNGAAINARSGEKEMTPLHMAAMENAASAAEALIERGADINATLNDRITTPMNLARAHDAPGVIALLAPFGGRDSVEVAWEEWVESAVRASGGAGKLSPSVASAGALWGKDAVMEIAGIYVIANERDGRVKIGKTGDFRSRFGQLRQECRSAGIPEIIPVALFPVNANRGSVELRAHKLLAQYRIAGEWFECSADKAVRAVLNSL